jgi:DNA-directed RNA polymerase subunit RPC12/RpoP
LVTVVGVSRPRTSGSAVTKSGKRPYRGKRKHWYVYFYDDDGKFRKRRISQVQVPYYGSLIRRRKTYLCPKCGTKFRSMQGSCPKCGAKAVKAVKRLGPTIQRFQTKNA